jgi:hypothetical protein
MSPGIQKQKETINDSRGDENVGKQWQDAAGSLLQQRNPAC